MTDIPAVGRPGCPRRPINEASHRGSQKCSACSRRFPTTTPRHRAKSWRGASREARSRLGKRLVILGHHYQREEVIQFADRRGDSLGLSRFAADQHEAEFVVFCGVHFMAESADILTGPHQQVILPDLNAGCSMADMANLDDVEQIWDELAEVTDVEAVVPITYVNSAAALKAFVGRNSGAVCTSSNARAVLTWALDREAHARGTVPLGLRSLGGLHEQPWPWEQGPFLPRPAPRPQYRLPARLRRLRHASHRSAPAPRRAWRMRRLRRPPSCSGRVTARFTSDFAPDHVEAFRSEHPEGIVIVHPECSHEVVAMADQVGSTDYIIGAVAAAPAGSTIAVGTEIHLVDRLARENPDRTVLSLDPLVCPCSTMFRIDLPHLAWVLDGLIAGEVRNRITVDEATAADARVALETDARHRVSATSRRAYPEPVTTNGLTQSETGEIQAAIEGARAATARLFTTLEAIEDLDVTRPSQLPDWTIGHVLTHLARNADSFAWILRQASEDRLVAQYPDGVDGRRRDISDGATRPADVILDDLRGSAARLDAAWDEVPEVVWLRHGLRTDGSPLPCRLLPLSRWRRGGGAPLDLGLGYGVSDWPADFVSLDLPHALDRLPALIEDEGQRRLCSAWVYGRAGLPARVDLRPF